MPAWPGCGEGIAPWVADSHLLTVSSHGLFSEYMNREGASSLVSLIRTLILSDQGPVLMTSVNLNDFLRGPISKYSHTRG